MKFPKIILASKSPRRSQLLEQAGFEFEIKTTEVEENYPDSLAPALVPEFLAKKKAYASKHFIEKKYGNIINIGSTAAINGFSNGSAYVASKFAVSGLTQCWRTELRPYNVRVMQINPSEVITDFFEKAGLEHKDVQNKLKPSEIAHLIVSMLSMNDIGFIPDASVWATNPWGK